MKVKKGERRSVVIVAALLDFLAPVVGEDHLRGVVARIARDVKRDLDEAADGEFNDSDLRLAIGRALCDLTACGKKKLKSPLAGRGFL